MSTIMADPRHPTPVDDDQRTSDVFERALFDSAHADAVPERSRHRVALALGLGGPSNGAGSGGATPTEPGGVPHGASTVAAGGATRGTLGAASQSLLVVVAGGLAALAFLGGSGDEIAPTRAASAPAQLAAPPSPAPPSPAPAVAAPASVETAAEPSAMPAPRALRRATTSRRATGKPPSTRAGATPAPRAESRLLEEVALLDLARAALAASDAPLALERVRHYSAEFPEGVLADEARRLEARARSHAEGSNPAPTRH
jgi:hypothetical protein